MPPEETQPTFFAAHRDGWLVFATILLIAFCLAGVPLSFWADFPLWQQVLTAGVLLLLAISALDKVFFTVYELNESGLSVHSQLRHIHVPYREMLEIRSGGLRGMFTTRSRKRFALSFRNIIIGVDDPLWREISISPDSRAFIDQLLATIDRERSRRATVSRTKRKKK